MQIHVNDLPIESLTQAQLESEVHPVSVGIDAGDGAQLDVVVRNRQNVQTAIIHIAVARGTSGAPDTIEAHIWTGNDLDSGRAPTLVVPMGLAAGGMPSAPAVPLLASDTARARIEELKAECAALRLAQEQREAQIRTLARNVCFNARQVTTPTSKLMGFSDRTHWRGYGLTAQSERLSLQKNIARRVVVAVE
jgi:hypothetical protein